MAATRQSSIVPVKKAECISSFETSGFESEEISKYINTTRSIAASIAKAMIMGLFFIFSVLFVGYVSNLQLITDIPIRRPQRKTGFASQGSAEYGFVISSI